MADTTSGPELQADKNTIHQVDDVTLHEKRSDETESLASVNDEPVCQHVPSRETLANRGRCPSRNSWVNLTCRKNSLFISLTNEQLSLRWLSFGLVRRFLYIYMVPFHRKYS